MPKLNSAQQGFTLIEGIMVILLIVILSATATSMFSGKKIFSERFFTDEVTQMIFYARKVAITTECDVEIAYQKSTLTLLQRENCQEGHFTRLLPAAYLLNNSQGFEIQVPKDVQLKGQFPLYIDNKGKFYEQENKKLEKITWYINRRMLNIDPFSGFTYESH